MYSIINRVLVVILILLFTGCNKGLKTQNQETYQSHGIIPLPLQADFLQET